MLPSLQSLSLRRRRGPPTGAPASNDKYLQDKYDSGRPFYDDTDSNSDDDAANTKLSEKAKGKLPAKDNDAANTDLSEKARGKLPAKEPDGKSLLDSLKSLQKVMAPIKQEEKKRRERRAGKGRSDTALNEKKPVENTPKQKKLEKEARVALLKEEIALGVVMDAINKQESAERIEGGSERYKQLKREAGQALWKWRRVTVPTEESTDLDIAVREGTEWVASEIIRPYVEANGEVGQMHEGSLKVWAHLESIVNDGLYAEAVYVVDQTNAFYRDMDADYSEALVFQEYTVAYLRKAFLGLAFNNNAAYRFADFMWARNDGLAYFNWQMAVLKGKKEMRELATTAGFFEPLLVLESTLNKVLRTDDVFYQDRRLFDPRTVPRNQVVATVDNSLHMYVQLKAAYEKLKEAYNGAADSLGAVVPDPLYNMIANLHSAMQMVSNVLKIMDGALPDDLLSLYADSVPPVRGDGTAATKEWYRDFHNYFRKTCETLFGHQSK